MAIWHLSQVQVPYRILRHLLSLNRSPAVFAALKFATVRSDIDPLYQQLRDPRLFGGKKLVPQGIEIHQRLAHVIFSQSFNL